MLHEGLFVMLNIVLAAYFLALIIVWIVDVRRKSGENATMPYDRIFIYGRNLD